MYEDDVVSKEVKSAARAPFADRDFLHAIGTTFLERVAKNATVPRSESGQIDVMMLDEPKPCSSREALKTTLTITHETHTLRRRTVSYCVIFSVKSISRNFSWSWFHGKIVFFFKNDDLLNYFPFYRILSDVMKPRQQRPDNWFWNLQLRMNSTKILKN